LQLAAFTCVYNSGLLIAYYYTQIRDDDAIYDEAYYSTPNEFYSKVR